MKARQIFFFAIMIVMLFAVLELFSFIFFSIFDDRYIFSDSYLIENHMLEKIESKYDYELGWDNKYDTEFGERPSNRTYSHSIMATFGDSYTYGDGVEDNETWQYFLSEIIGQNVRNFGTSAYGTDQALLKFRRDFPAVQTKIAALCFIGENINRIVNVYRPFYHPKTGVPMTKPLFIMENGSLSLMKNPIKKAENYHWLQDPHYLNALGQYDYWYMNRRLPDLSFPYSAIFTNRVFWEESLSSSGTPVFSEDRERLAEVLKGGRYQAIERDFLH